MQSGPALPLSASAASQLRLQLARQLTASCPPALGAAIALTGSSAHGLADDSSDAEINHWVEHIPPVEARVTYLTEAGVTDLAAEAAPRSDGSEWFQGYRGEIPVEVGWQTFGGLEQSMRPLLTGETSERGALRLGELLTSAVILRGDGRLLRWRERLIRFPDPLRDRLITELRAPLTDETAWAAVERLARRDERLTVAGSLALSLKTAVRLCFAINRRWEAGDKWLLALAADLPVMPPNWRARLDDSLSAPPVQAVQLARAWCDDALALIGGHYARLTE